MTTLSVILITKNAGATLNTCLQSVAFADEIIVVDSGSSDDTLVICQKYNAKIYQTDWPGFGPQKNRALNYASGDWILSIDADEEVTPELKNSILNTIKQSTSANSVYSIKRVSQYCGRFLYHGDWRNDVCVRLFSKQAGAFSNVPVHESFISTLPVKKLAGVLMHYTYPNLAVVIDKMNSYSTLGAEMRFKRGKKSSLSKALLHALWSFFRGYILRAGFLDGREGFILAISNAEYVYYRYLKLWLLNAKKSF